MTTYVNQAVITGTKVLVPPSIRPHKPSGGTEVRLEIEDRVHRPALVKITADHVRIHITSNVAVQEAVQTVGVEGAAMTADGDHDRTNPSPCLQGT